MLKASFTFCSLEPLNKNGQCHHSITGLNDVHLIWMGCLPLYLIIEKRYIEYDEGVNTDAWL